MRTAPTALPGSSLVCRILTAISGQAGRAAMTLLEILISTSVLAVVVVVVGQSLASGTAVQKSVAARGDSEETVARLVKVVTQDLRYADVNKIWFDTNNNPTWYTSVDDVDQYCFKVCTGFNSSATSASSLGALSTFGSVVILQFSRVDQTSPPSPSSAKGKLTRITYPINANGVQTGDAMTQILSDSLAWCYIDPANPSAGAQRGFAISQLDPGSATVVGKRLSVAAAMRPSTVTTVNTTTAGLPEVTPVSTASSAVYLRSTMFSGFGVSPPVITSELSRTANVGTAMSYDIIATNYPDTYTAFPLPAGLIISATSGNISGTPQTTGGTAITITAANAAGTDSKVLNLTVNGPVPVLTSSANINGLRSASLSYQITATNNPMYFSIPNLPSGLSLNRITGWISGYPTTTGSVNCPLTMVNANGVGTATLVLNITDTTLPAPVVTNATLSGSVGSAFLYQINATNSPTTYTCSTLPGGLSFNAATGVISGSPTAAWSGTLTVTAGNSSGTGSGTLTLAIASGVQAPVVTSQTVTGTVGSALNCTIVATNGPTSYGASGAPSWLTGPSSTGMLSGTPSAAGNYSVGLTATNAGGTGSGTLTLAIASLPAPAITSVLSAQGSATVLFSYTITASNNPTSFAATSLPPGVTVNTATGLISGTPTSAGTWTSALAATNDGGTGTANLAITIAEAPQPPAISLGAATITGRNWQVIGSYTARTGYPVDTSTFYWRAVLNSQVSSAFTLSRGWIAGEAGNGSKALNSNEFMISGSTFTGSLTLYVAIADTSGNTGSTNRSY